MSYGDLHYDLERCRDLLEDELYEEAFEVALDLLERAPLETDVVSAYCDAALACLRPLEALKACRPLARRSDVEPEILEWLLRAQWDLHLTEQCRATCRRLLDLSPVNYVAADYGLATVLELQDFDEADDLIDRAQQLSEDDPHLAYQVAVARMMRSRGSDEAEALATFEDFLARDPAEPGTYINLMRIHHLSERYGKVEDLFREAQAAGLEHEDLYFNMGLALKAREQDRPAARYFARSVRMNPKLPDAHFHLGQILRTENHPRFALAMLERELAVDDTQPAVHAEMAWCAEDIGEYAAAIRMIRAAVERAPSWAIYQHSLAELLLKVDPRDAEAGEVAQAAVELDSGHAAGWQVLGRLAAERGDLETAEAHLRRAVKAHDATAEDQGWLGLLLAQAGRTEEARPLLEWAVRTFPYWEPVGDALGRLRGHPLPYRFEIRLRSPEAGEPRPFRILHVVSTSEAGARAVAREEGAPATVEEVRGLGFEVDRPPGVVWDSGPSRSPHPPGPRPVEG